MALVRLYPLKGPSIDNTVANVHAARGPWIPSPGANPEIHLLSLVKTDQVVSDQELQFVYPDGVSGHASLQFVFGYQLPNDAVFGGTFDVGFYVWINNGASAATLDGHWVVHAWVSEGATGNVRGTLVSNYAEATGVNTFPSSGSTAISNPSVTATQLAAPVTMTSLGALAGDYLIVECGFVEYQSAIPAAGIFRFGTRDAAGNITADVVAGDASVDQHATWIELEIDAASSRNLLTGFSHTVQGSDNLIAGSGGTVTGNTNALFALCDDSPAPEIVGDRTFRVCADTIDLTADTLLLNGVDAAQILHATATLTDAQIKALPTTPITLIAAPGSSLRIDVLFASLRANTASGAYTNINATYAALALYWLGDFSQWATVGIVDDATAVPTLDKLTTLIGAASTRSTRLIPYQDIFTNGWVIPNVVGSSISDDKALAIAADNNGSGAFTGGNAANSLQVDVFYTIASAA